MSIYYSGWYGNFFKVEKHDIMSLEKITLSLYGNISKKTVDLCDSDNQSHMVNEEDEKKDPKLEKSLVPENTDNLKGIFIKDSFYIY